MSDKLFFIFSETGVVVGTIPPPPTPPANYVLLDADTPLHDVDGRMLAPDGSYRWMLMSQPCFGGLDGRTAMLVPDDAALAGKSWSDLAAMTSVDHPHGLLQAARPETTAERRAREKAAADAATAAEAARIAALVVDDIQFSLACVPAGIITAAEAEAWAGAVLPASLAAAIELLPEGQRAEARIRAAGMKEFRRSAPFVVALGAAMGKTPAEIDALFLLAATL